jgi:thimet oligopeptidase
LLLRVAVLVGVIAAPIAPVQAQSPVGASKLLTATPEAFLAACRVDIDQARASAAQFRTADTRDPLAALDRYDAAVGLLADAASRASLARNVHPEEAMRNAASDCESDVDKAATELSLDRPIYDALTRLNVSLADAATKHYVAKTIRDFRRAGVDKDEATRSRVKALREELVKLGQQFQANIASDVRTLELEPAELDGLPDDFKRAHPVNGHGKVALTTNNTDYQPFAMYAKSAKAREEFWKIYQLRGHPKNLPVLNRMLEARKELANLLGFPTWADYITGDKMVGTRQAASDFIQKIAAAADDRLNADYKALLARKQRETPGAPAVDAWDSAYLQEQVKADLHKYDAQSVRPYFEYRRVKQGVMDLTSRMFGITFRAVPAAAVWHPDVEAFDVLEGSRLLGRIYLDMYPRDNKFKHYAHFTLTNGKANGILPESVLVCNFPKPGAEPGHLLHHVFGGHTRWAGISGVATERDFVEAPSQMLEEWVWTPDTLQTFARHYQTNEPIPADLVKRMKAADEFGKGIVVRQQMFYAATSLELHTRDPKGLDAGRVVAELQNKLTPFKFVDGTHFEESFPHLDGYSAIYYTYMWSLVIAKDLFTVFDKQGLLNPEAARLYRRTVLEPGGSKPAADLVKDFLGRPYTFDAYRAWLNAN